MKIPTIAMALLLAGGFAGAQLPPTVTYVENTTLTRSGRMMLHGINFEQSGQVLISGQPALVVPIPGTNAVEMNAYVPEDTPFGTHQLRAVNSVGQSNPITIEVVPRIPSGRELWRFTMNNQIMLHRPALGADGTIYAKSQGGDVIALTPHGAMKWKLDVGGDLTPTIDVGPDGTIYTAAGGPTIYAINPDGTIKWTWTDPFPNQGMVAGPNVGPDGNIYGVTHVPGLGVVSLDPDGELRWSGPDRTIYWPPGQVGQEVVFSDTQLFFCINGYVESFDFDGNQAYQNFTLTSPAADSPQMAVGPNGDSYVEFWGQLMSFAPGGSQNWMVFGAGGNYLRDPDVGPDGTIYVPRNVFNTFYAVNPDGSTKWSRTHPKTFLHPSVAPTGEAIVVGAGGGANDVFLALDPEDGALRWELALPVETPDPWTTLQVGPQGRARWTPDGSVAYHGAIGKSGSPGYCYLYALQVGTSVDIGHSLTGSAGVPRLTSSGTLESGSPISVSLTGARPGATAYFVFGRQAVGLPFRQGVVVPSPDTVVTRTLDGTGARTLAGTWYTGLPSSTPAYAQVWIVDPGVPGGFAASNALSLITP